MAENTGTAVVEAKSETQEKWAHPLEGREVLGQELWSYPWKAWLEGWAKPVYWQELVNHLHVAFDSYSDNSGERQERILFFLGIANPVHPKTADKCPKCKVSSKAFSSLCQWVFKNTAERNEPQSWFRDIVSAGVLPKLFQFLKNCSDTFWHNFDWNGALSEHEKLILNNFLVELSLSAWKLPEWSRYPQDLLLRQHRLLRENRPEFLKILYHLGELERLWEYRGEITREDIEVLRGFAFQKRRFESGEPPVSLGEALIWGSEPSNRIKVARTLCWIEKYFQESERQKAECEEAQNALESLEAEIVANRESIAEIQRFFLESTGSAKEIREKQKALAVNKEELCSREARIFNLRDALQACRKKQRGY